MIFMLNFIIINFDLKKVKMNLKFVINHVSKLLSRMKRL